MTGSSSGLTRSERRTQLNRAPEIPARFTVLCEFPYEPGPGCTCKRSRAALPTAKGCDSAYCPPGTSAQSVGVACQCVDAEGEAAPFPPKGIDPVADPEHPGVELLRVSVDPPRTLVMQPYAVGTIPGRYCTSGGCLFEIGFRGTGPLATSR